MNRVGLWHQIKQFKREDAGTRALYALPGETLIECHIRKYGMRASLGGARGMHISDYIHIAMLRLVRLYRIKTIGGWNDCCEKAAVAISGNPDSTLRKLHISVRERNRNKPFIINKWGNVEPKRWFWSDQSISLERLRGFRARAENRRNLAIEVQERTCGSCGKVSEKRSVVGVCRRWELTEFFATKEAPWWHPETERRATVCVGCWNKTKPATTAWWESKKINADIRKLKRAISERKKYNGQDSRSSGAGIGAGDGR